MLIFDSLKQFAPFFLHRASSFSLKAEVIPQRMRLPRASLLRGLKVPAQDLPRFLLARPSPRSQDFFAGLRDSLSAPLHSYSVIHADPSRRIAALPLRPSRSLFFLHSAARPTGLLTGCRSRRPSRTRHRALSSRRSLPAYGPGRSR